MDLKEGRQASGGRAGGLPSRLACNMGPPRRVSFAVDGPPQPQTATCCTALQPGFTPECLTAAVEDMDVAQLAETCLRPAF